MDAIIHHYIWLQKKDIWIAANLYVKKLAMKILKMIRKKTPLQVASIKNHLQVVSSKVMY